MHGRLRGVRVLFVGDVFGTPGLRATRAYLREVRDRFDVVVVNGENATGGFGLGRKHFEQLRDAGADVVTLGNHAFNQKDTAELLEETRHLIRPLNYPPGTPGLGAVTLDLPGGDRVTVAQVLGRIFLEPIDDPFRALDGLFESLDGNHPVILDLHAEATSEKKVLGWHAAGRAAAAIGTHTHVQTADETIVRGTAYLTDVGMSGVLASSIGMQYEEVHARFTRKPSPRWRPATGRATVCAVEIDIDGTRATAIRRIQWTEEGDEGPR